MNKSIYLIGFMAAGKSSTGKKLAAKLKVPFIDLDEAITAKAGKAITKIFESDGEEAFRQMEHECLLETAQSPAAVIACGGGTPCFHDNMKWMKENGTTIYLKLFPKGVLSRLKKQEITQRPLLKEAEDIETYVQKEWEKRNPIYQEADIVIDALEVKAPQLLTLLKDTEIID